MASDSYFHHRVDCSTGEVSQVPFTKDEAEQRAKDEAAYCERAAADQREAAKRDEIKAALAAGEATHEQMQHALALLMQAAL